jgi:mannose-6-phosphate isomerase-like protein (cupin superfamily)
VGPASATLAAMITTSVPAPAAPLEIIEFPDGQRHEVVSADVDHLVIAFSVPPMPVPNAPHVHDSADEVFEVLAGHLLFTLNGVAHHLAAGDSIVIPHGAQHSWQVVGDRDLDARVTFTPGCRFDAFLRDLAALHDAGRIGDAGTPCFRDYALLQRRHWSDLRLTVAPKPVLRVLVALGAALAGLTGRRLPAAVGVVGGDVVFRGSSLDD